ncbi:hypothetical protein PMIN04_012298 [Paraphaeosphaeria minitans]
MDGYVQTVTSLGVYSPQNLSPEILEQVLDSLKRETLKMEVVKLLLPVRAFPVSRAALQRISSLLKFMSTRAKQSDERVQTLRSLNCVSLIICGLCLTQKSVEGMKRELFDAFISQVIKTSQGSIHAILEDSEIRKAVLSSRTDQEFLQIKSQIAAEFGQDVFEAAESSNLWTQDTGEIETKCLKVDVYPGQFMVLGLAIGWTRCYEFMNSLYRS